MKKLNLKLKKNIKESLNEEGGRKKDTRFLNYYDLRDGEKMTVLIVPDVNGELWTKYKVHSGNNLDAKSAGSIRCAYESSGEDCPACQQGFEWLNAHKESGDKEDKEIAKKWFGKDSTIMSVIVLEASIEIQESPDQNLIKLMHVPYKIEAMIKESIIEGQIEEDMIPYTPLIIKKGKNPGGYATYDKSYFDRKEISDDDLEFLEDQVVEQFDYSNLDVVPKATTTEQVQEWVDKVLTVIEGSSDDGDGEKEEAKEEKPVKASKTPLSRFKKEDKEVDSQQEEQEEEQDDGGAPEVEKEEEGSATESLKDRLNRLKKK
jgi:hypothetical protein